MAMKMNAAEKANDSTIRAFNAQIEKAFRTLGYNHTVTQNLVNKAVSIYGKGAMKEMKITQGYSEGQINKSTGEIYGIPQIQRTRATLGQTTKAKALKNATQFTQGDKKGQYKSMYDVTKAHQKAIQQVRQSIIKQIPNEKLKTLTPKQIEREIKRNLTPDKITKKIAENDLASEIFDAYAKAKEDGDDTELYEDFAKDFHEGKDLDMDLIRAIQEQRFNTMLAKSLENPDDNAGLTGQDLNDFFSGFEEIYNPFIPI